MKLNKTKVNKLINSLKKMRISRKFAKIVYQLTKLIKDPREPVNYILKGYRLNKRYAHIISYKDKIKIKDIVIDAGGNKNKAIIIPVDVDNKVTKNKHLILFVYNPKNKQIRRIDPSYISHTKITERKMHNAFKKYSKKFIYKGFHKKSKFLIHRGLCRFVTPLLLIYGHRLTRPIIKNEIIKHFVELINRFKK